MKDNSSQSPIASLSKAVLIGWLMLAGLQSSFIIFSPQPTPTKQIVKGVR